MEADEIDSFMYCWRYIGNSVKKIKHSLVLKELFI